MNKAVRHSPFTVPEYIRLRDLEEVYPVERAVVQVAQAAQHLHQPAQVRLLARQPPPQHAHLRAQLARHLTGHGDREYVITLTRVTLGATGRARALGPITPADYRDRQIVGFIEIKTRKTKRTGS